MVETDEKKTAEISEDKNYYGLSDEASKEIIGALEDQDHSRVRELVEDLHVADVADLVDSISHDQRRDFINSIRKIFDPEILVELSSNIKEEIIALLGIKDSANAITKLDTDDAIDFIEDLALEGQQEILDAVPDQHRLELEEGLAYPEQSAGRLLDKKIVSVPEFWDVGQAIDFLRSEKELPDEFYQIYIVDPKMKPIGGVMLSQIMRSKRKVKLHDIMQTDLKLIKSDMDQEEVAFIFRQYGLASAPVVNEEGRVIGIITVDDIVHVMEEEAQEDIMRLGGVSETDVHSSLISTLQRRFPWLIVNLVTAIAASIVIAYFEGTIEKFAALAVLMPIVASMGGNAGTQTVTVTVRAIATKELTTTNAMRVVSKEILVGGLNGFVFAIISGIAAYMWYENLYLSLVFASATIATLLLAGLSGALIPIGLVKVGVDPAIASSVALTTITDIVAFGVFLGLAANFLL